jgi:hypothetical protein
MPTGINRKALYGMLCNWLSWLHYSIVFGLWQVCSSSFDRSNIGKFLKIATDCNFFFEKLRFYL